MNRPTVKAFKKPQHILEYPEAPCFEAGHLVTENAGWRTDRPVYAAQKCIGCFYCYLCCPEGVISKTPDNKVEIDHAFCKGCGICAKVCKKTAFTMEKEG
ncbi:MAG: 4Fe-4S binding protein [Clostridia bacterium]|nr:4Fe-4S binding protein [Clostridia bacterium]